MRTAKTCAQMSWPPPRLILALLFIGQLLTPPVSDAADANDARKLFIKGEYQECLKLAEKAVRDEDSGEDWRLVLVETQMMLGRYADAVKTVTTNLNRYPLSASVRLRLLANEVFHYDSQHDRAKQMLDEANQLAGSRSWAYRDTPNIMAMGRIALKLGADPKLVLDKLYDPLMKKVLASAPTPPTPAPAKLADLADRDIFLACGDLALDKHDDDLAAKTFLDALKLFPDDADMMYGLARAYASSGRVKMLHMLDKALEQNTNHIGSLLLIADHLVDAEEYKEAEEYLERVFKINPSHPEAWAYRAVLAHLQNDVEGEKRARRQALRHHDTNPDVDHLVGRKLSAKYRFAEGSEYQKRALKFDKNYLPAKGQLANDLLRLGEEDEGWTLADEVYQADGYDVAAYNLVTLKDTMEKFQTITNEHFIVRMGPREAQIYGGRVMALLDRAKTNLCEKYGIKLEQPTIVEIFPEQKDFAVRTFGMPGGAGYLGVCFGRVITANSPASQAAHPSNWEAVLWHEFCHVITLTMTKNKMPRWLSEGISVHEELQANPIWGQTMNPRYREMVLGKDLVPVADLSGAFLAPKSDLHMQFAYYESALVVEFLVKNYGLESLKKILGDLGQGIEINKAIAAHTAPMEKIETEFAAFAKERAEKLAPELEWEKPSFEDDLKKGDPAAISEWVARNPKNYYALSQQARQLIKEKKWDEAKAPLKKLIELYPGNVGSGNAYAMLAEVYRNLKETKEEREVLEILAARSADSVDSYLRLLEMAETSSDWPAVSLNANRLLAVNPLLPQPHRSLARASEVLGQSQPAIVAYQTLLLMDPPDPADVHYRLAKLLKPKDESAARRHVLQALEEAPRFRDAHKLLLEMGGGAAKPPEEKKPFKVF
jgi:tetratricopeptide (TPR) repeat protein